VNDKMQPVPESRHARGADIRRDRRTFLKSTLAASALGLLGTALLKPLRALAADWPKAAFESKKLDEALKGLYGTSAMTASGSVRIKAPPQAENGAVVPIAVSTELPNVESIAILVEKNPNPLIAHVSFVPGAEGYFSARMKMGQTSDVYAVVRSGGKLYSARQTIKVTVGGCGG
jgi:sulfur-oxidizing protein SoxY